MSFELMAWAMRQEVGSSSDKFVLLALADRANGDTGECFPSVALIAIDTEMSEATVRRCLKSLADKGIVKRARRRREDGSLGVYDYEFPLAQDLRTPPLTMSARATDQDERAEPRRGEDLEPIEASPLAGAANRIYAHWRAERGKHRSSYDVMSPARRKKIEQRLREFSEADLLRAISAVALDPWPERKRHDDLTVILRSREQVDRFLEMAERGSDIHAFHDHARQAVERARSRHAG